ncbi:DUF2637 domain-containing protein [Gordonia sp. 852002-10350_SCH5691597]|uniref:DUF2637 domain-containing protein n=1 Tax=Gordonia sp. 852002-10350_SCH5691597 TaxID=1834085 RepID=UPI0007E95F22|nr:helix-turn-helix domain-containing protein [Gordonia sp. 852002-10350_SCH5691597]OBA67776.1 hypothetical protein A5777_16510 [Gordonia sp. 852002-10350_SCH5691597]
MSKLPNPFRLAPGREDYGYTYYFWVVFGAALLSVVGNVTAYAVDELPYWVVWIIHGLPPVIAVLMLHMFSSIRASFMGAIRRDPSIRPASPYSGLTRRERLRSWSVADLALAFVLALLVGAVVAIALAVSFVSLAAVGEMAGWEGRIAWALPLMLDLPAFAATIGFIKSGHRIAADEVVASAVTIDSPDQASPSLSSAAEFGSSAEFDDGVGMTAPPNSAGRMEGGSAVVSAASASTDDQARRASAEFRDEVRSQVAEMVDAEVAELPVPTIPPSSAPVEAAESASTLAEFDPPSSGWAAEADEVKSATRISAGAAELAMVLELDARGRSQQEIADEVGRSRSTVGGWLKTVRAHRAKSSVLALAGGPSAGRR